LLRYDDFRTRARPSEPYPDYMGRGFSKLSIRLSYILARTSVTPNQVTLLSTVVAFLAAAIIRSPTYWMRLVGVVVWFIGYILDLCDGDIARYRSMKSEFGHWFEAVSDRAKDLALLAAVTALAFSQVRASWVIWAGCLAVGGTLLHSYTITYGFKATKPFQPSPVAKFGQIHYVLMAAFVILNLVPIYLVIVSVTSLGAVALNVYSTWKASSPRTGQ